MSERRKKKKIAKKQAVDLYLRTSPDGTECPDQDGLWYLEGEYSIDGEDWKPCTVIWSEDGGVQEETFKNL